MLSNRSPSYRSIRNSLPLRVKRVFLSSVMTFSLHNKPAAFQRIINRVLGNLVGSCCISYMETILVSLKDLSQNTKSIEKVLAALSNSDLKLKPSRCDFYPDKVSFLENVVLRDGHVIFSEKTKDISELVIPKNKSEVRGFLCTVNFFLRFCKDISQLFAPLTYLIGDVPFVWRDLHQTAFEKLKVLIASASVPANTISGNSSFLRQMLQILRQAQSFSS